MTEPAIESRVSRLESGQADLQALQADHAAWRREMEAAQRDFWRRDEALQRKLDRFAEEARARSEDLDRRFQESREDFDRRLQETDRLMKELRQDTRELGKQIGGLGQKFGSFTEGMALPSMERQLAERFGTTKFAVRPRVRLGKHELEVDAIAYSDGETGVVCLVDVKSHLRDEGIDQFLRTLERFPRFFSEHRGKKLIGLLAVVDARHDLVARVLREGLVLARIRDDVFELQIPAGFQPRAFPNPHTTADA